MLLGLMFFLVSERMGVEAGPGFMFDIGTLSEHVSWKSCEIFRDENFSLCHEVLILPMFY